jgi:hypothetical protein
MDMRLCSERESTALREVHMVVAEMAQLKESLTAAVLNSSCLFHIFKYEKQQ